MPSASAKIEKIASIEAADPVKQFIITLEKKVRNLEKRKLKLDNYKSDVQNGKELNEDQKNAVSKYDVVVEVLDYSKELCKSFNSIVLESSRQQKKLAKKEQIERQQHEIQRLQEALYYKHILASLENEDVRNDFLSGENGATKLTSEDLTYLDQFYKLIEPSLPNDQADIEGHFHTLAENFIFLVEGKNKEVAGTTYKALKELLHGMKISGYFQRSSDNNEGDEMSSDEVPDIEENIIEKEDRPSTDSEYSATDVQTTGNEITEKIESAVEISNVSDTPIQKNVPEEIKQDQNAFNMHNGPLQEVLASHGSFNFLQESQIDIDTPHMDPAVVAVHQMAPSAGMNFSVNTYQSEPADENSNHLEAEAENEDGNSTDSVTQQQATQQQPMTVLTATISPRNIPPVLASVPPCNGHEFDPNHPIPTQTFTNQNFAVMQNIIMPPAYVPVTMHHGPIPPHMPIAVVPGLSPPVSTPTSCSVPIHVAVAPIPVASVTNPVASEPVNGEVLNCEPQQTITNGNASSPEIEVQNDISPEKNSNDGEGFNATNNYRGGFRGRSRGRNQMNGYFRGRGGYNSMRGGYQGHNNYYPGGGGAGNYRRNNMRGAPRGSNNMRSRGNGYRQQSQSQQ